MSQATGHTPLGALMHQRCCLHTLPISRRNCRPARALQIRASRDPWKVLGVDANATEKEIKQAHRKLVLRHHPDLAGDDMGARAKFISIQEAYELLTGKRLGKEVEGRPSGSWDFHDWYWRFSMKRRYGRVAKDEGARPAPEAQRHQWRQQLGGLKQKAASKRMQPWSRKQQQEAASRPEGPAAAASSSVWRSTTKTARAQQQQQQQQQTVRRPQPVETMHARVTASAGSAEAVSSSETPVAAASHAAAQAPQSPIGERQQQSGGNATGAQTPVCPDAIASTHSVQLNELLQGAVHAMHDVRHRHAHAAQRVTSQIVAFGEQVRTRLHLKGLRDLLSLDHSTQAQLVQRPVSVAPQGRHFSGSDGGAARGDGGAALGSELRVQFAEGGGRCGSKTSSAAEGGAPWDSARCWTDSHSRKFADHEHVRSRLTAQTAGLKRRAALKRELEL